MKSIISTSGISLSFDKQAIKDLEAQAKKCYNDSIRYFKATKGLSNKKVIQFEKTFRGCKGEFQYSTTHYVVSYKRSLLKEFTGYKFQMQFIKPFENVPAGTILKW